MEIQPSQRSLAEISELIYAANVVHDGIVDIDAEAGDLLIDLCTPFQPPVRASICDSDRGGSTDSCFASLWGVAGLDARDAGLCWVVVIVHAADTTHDTSVYIDNIIHTIPKVAAAGVGGDNNSYGAGADTGSSAADDEELAKAEQIRGLIFGNKMAILGGDFLLASACTGK